METFDPKKIILNRQKMIHDHRDYRLLDYITPAMRQKALGIAVQDWPIHHLLDQDGTPHCVGYAWANFGISIPVEHLDWTNEMGECIYYQAKIYDGEEGQENGSSTRSGVKAFMDFAALDGGLYAFVTSMDDLIVWVKTIGPVVTGTNWYTLMFSPDSNGQVHIAGMIEGGHEWMISGVDDNKRLFHCTNSWGTGFGINGQFYISYDDYGRLLNEQGDAVTCTEIPVAPQPPVPPIPPAPNPGCLPRSLYWLYKKTL